MTSLMTAQPPVTAQTRTPEPLEATTPSRITEQPHSNEQTPPVEQAEQVRPADQPVNQPQTPEQLQMTEHTQPTEHTQRTTPSQATEQPASGEQARKVAEEQVQTVAKEGVQTVAEEETQTVAEEEASDGGPAPRSLTDEELVRLLGGQQFGTLATLKKSGHPHLSTVLYSWDAEERIVRISTTADRVKVRQLQRNPRAALHVNGGDVWSFAVAEGDAEVSEVTAVPGDAVSRELASMGAGFEDSAEEAAFFKQMVKERRVVIRLRVSRLYGTALDF